MAARVTELKELNDALGDAGEPRRRIDEDGSLFLRKLGYPRKIRDPRRRILNGYEDGGWLAAGTPFEEAIADIEAAKKARLVFPYSGTNREHAAI